MSFLPIRRIGQFRYSAKNPRVLDPMRQAGPKALESESPCAPALVNTLIDSMDEFNILMLCAMSCVINNFLSTSIT